MRLRQLIVLSTLGAFAASGQAVITAVAGDALSQTCGYSGDGGPATQALLCNAQAPVADSGNNLYFVDSNNHVIRKVTPAGIISTIAGTGVQGTSGDGGPALSAQIGAPGQLAYDTINYVCFGDQMAYKIRCVSLVTGLMRSIGAGVSGYAGDGGPVDNAAFGQVVSLLFLQRVRASTVFSDLYFTDYTNNVVRKVDGYTGIITTFAGNGVKATSGDGGPASAASLNGPGTLAYNNGMLYITEVAGSRVRAVNLSTGIITTFAGTGANAYTGDGGPATAAGLGVPLEIAADGGGNLFILDFASHIRKVDPTGIITTYAGANNNGFSGQDNVVPSLTKFNTLNGIVWNNQSNTLLLGDSNRIRQIVYQGSTTQLDVSPIAYSIGSAMTLTASVQPVAATGSVSFFFNNAYLGTSTLAGGQAAFSVTATASTGTYWAIYHGDATYASSHSPGPPVSFAAGIGLSSSANPAQIYQPVTFSVSLTPAAATGTVQFFVNGTLSATVPVANGTATFSTNFTSVGTSNVIATYNGDGNYGQASSGNLTQTVTAIPTGVSLTQFSDPTALGQPATFTALVYSMGANGGSNPTGTVQFFDIITPLGAPQAVPGNGLVTFVTTAFTLGAHTISAAYSGDASHAPGPSQQLIHTVKKTPNVTIASSSNPAAAGQSIAYTTTTDPAATGYVQFQRGGSVLATILLQGGTATYATSTQAAGATTVYAYYQGDSNYISDSASLTQTVNPPNPAVITVASNLNPSNFGNTITLTSTVTPATASGMIQFLDGTTALGTVYLTGGTAALNVATLTAGTHSITAVYSGDVANGASTSPALSQVVKANSTTTLNASANPSAFGNSVTFNAIMTPSPVNGTVQFLDGATVLGTASATFFGASFSTTGLSVGTHSITAVYSGDASTVSSTSAVLSQVVNKAPTTTALASGANPANSGASVGFTATVAPATATGTVQFLDGTTVLGTATIISGTATLNTTTLVAGTHNITVIYSGDASNAASTSGALAQVINKAPTTSSLTSSANPANSGAPVGLTATVAPATATGTVQFLDGTSVLGTATISSGSATLNITTLVAGTHNITAIYSGDASNATSTSGALAQVINKTPTTTTVTSSANPANSGAAVGLTATVTPATATGTVQFLDGASILGTATISSGSATLSLTTLASGTHSITASYSGDASNATSTSGALAQVINKTSTTTALASSTNPANSGASVGLTATVTPATASGTVQFFDGITVLGTATISSGTATFSLTTLASGMHSITAVYSGDASNATSTSAALAQIINLATTTTTLGSNVPTATLGTPVALTATVTPGTATGTVQFLDGPTVLGTATLAGGSATLTVSTFAVGSHSITAVYSGDLANATSTSAPLAQVISKVLTAITLSSGWNPTIPGYTFTLTSAVTPAAATGIVQFLEGTTVLGSATLTNGSASVTISTLPLGAHNVVAVYGGDVVNVTSTSPVLVQVTKSIPTIIVTSTLNPSQVGQSVTFTATMNVTATGTVQFLDNDTLFGTATLSGGACSVSTSALTQGTHTISLAYSGDATYMSTSGGGVIQTVKPKPVSTTTIVTSSQNPTLYSTSVTLTAMVTPASATGTIQFMDGANPIATVPVTSGAATFSFASLSVGTNSIIAIYSGDANSLTSTSTALAQVVNKVTTTTAVASSANPSTAGGSITLTANVTPAAVIIANGTVQFLDGATVLGVSTLSSGGTSFTIASLAAGTHSLTVVYGGDANNLASTSPALVQVVNKAPATLALTSSLNPSVVGNNVTFAATVVPATATGTLQFLDGSTVLGTATLASGGGAVATATLATGTHNITVVYSGDGNNLASTSAALVQVVNKAVTTGAVTSSLNPSIFGNSVTFTAAVSPATATGTVQFRDGSTVLSTATLASGLATLSTSTLAVGTHNLTVVYSGDANNASSTSPALAQIVTKAATSTVVTSSLNPSVVGNSVTFTAALTPATATGTVQFLDGSTVLGTATLASGRATLTTAALASSTHAISAIYSGDTLNLGSTSTALTQSVSPSAPSSLSANAASSSQINLSWTASATTGVTYNVYMSTTSGFTPSAANKIASGLTGTTYTATGLNAATAYYFKVRASDSGGESTATTQATATTTAALSCHVVYNVTSHNSTTFSSMFNIQNSGTSAISNWTLTWAWPGNQTLTSASNATFSQTGVNATLTHTSGNGTIGAGSTLNGVTINAHYSGTNSNPTAFYVNGTLCH